MKFQNLWFYPEPHIKDFVVFIGSSFNLATENDNSKILDAAPWKSSEKDVAKFNIRISRLRAVIAQSV
jgi:hypothetical protein